MSAAAQAELRQVTAAIGRDPMLTQGAGGNTSVKCDGELWVKASGAWMRDAEERSIFVPVRLDVLVEAVARADEPALDALMRASVTSDGLRPSIEAAMHAVMPQRAVVHAHAINSTICAVLADGEARFRGAVDEIGVSGCVIPYIKPGLSLALEIARLNAESGAADILLLQNHGVVVAAESMREAYDLLCAMERTLDFPVRMQFEQSSMNADDGPVAPGFERDGAHAAIARDVELCAALAAAPLTPDQVVFLGGAPCVVRPDETLEAAARRAFAESGVAPALFYLPGKGAFRRANLTAGEAAQCEALVEIARRLPRDCAVVGLETDAARALGAWEAEQFRRAADAARA